MAVHEKSLTGPKQEIANLGDGQVFVRRTPTGLIQSVKGNITLEERKGQIAMIQGKGMTTAAGFYELNKISSLSVITPDKLTLPEGNLVVNPYPIVDPESGSISKVWTKKLSIGYSPIGNLVVTSATLLFDIKMYFIQDLAKKIQKNKSAGRLCHEQQLTDDEKKKGIFFRIEGQFGVWADFNNSDVLTAMDTFIQNKLFAERKAQTICERMVLRKHPALSAYAYLDVQGTEKNHFAVAKDIVGFMHDFDQDQLKEMAERAAAGESIKVDGKEVEVQETVGQATDEDIVTALDDEEAVQTTINIEGGELL